MFKGKQQLYWSNGLKSRLGVANRTDEELAEETEKREYRNSRSGYPDLAASVAV